MSGIIAQNSGRHTGLVKAASGGGGVWNLIETLTASSSATLSFTSGIDSTYDEYVFKFNNTHPGTSNAKFTFQTSTDTGSSYGVVLTSTFFRALHSEDNSVATVDYDTGDDLAQSTSYQIISSAVSNDNDASTSGYLNLFAPSDTTFVKHYILRTNCLAYTGEDYSGDIYSAGYFNTTSAVDAVQFKYSSGNIDAGTISMYGIT